jgi:hypothetical protein
LILLPLSAWLKPCPFKTDGKTAFFRRPYGAKSFLLEAFPTLKRGANQPCAYGAAEIGTTQGLSQNYLQLADTR